MEEKRKRVIVKSRTLNIKHGGIGTRAAVSPDGRFLVEGEANHPESDNRNAIIKVKDLKTGLVHGNNLLWT